VNAAVGITILKEKTPGFVRRVAGLIISKRQNGKDWPKHPKGLFVPNVVPPIFILR
jgi:hypothetical protein